MSINHTILCRGVYLHITHFAWFFLQNLPRDALPDGSPIREKLATFKRPRKFKTSENDFSHGSFFLRIGGISKCKVQNMKIQLQIIDILSLLIGSSKLIKIPYFYSFWIGNNDLQWLRAWNIFWDPMELAMLSSSPRNQPHLTNDLHIQPNVFCIHERAGT